MERFIISHVAIRKSLKEISNHRYLWGLDISLTCTGVTIYDLDDKEFVHIDSFNTEKIKAIKNRYHNAIKLKAKADWLLELKEKYPPYFIGIERGFSRYNNSTQTIFRVHGLANYLFHDIPQEYYAVKKIKEVIVHGSATKEDVAITINQKYPFYFENEDESDSFSVVLTVLIDKGLIEWEKPKWSEIKKLRVPKPKKTKKPKKEKV